ncbi:hypothetical protein HHK36_031132 [Tetracentron sinense]|uniref:CCT-beta n=1 Tax=Tetracentron sinense TaxID=13715 RepID=A0A834YCZ3_TETSI|nr:hypothetical protein HHK36_031132 [Tetracentron sinense]
MVLLNLCVSDISKVQDDEVGDGTTSVVVLAGELLREAEKLVAVKIHPMTIISGYRMAANVHAMLCCRKSWIIKRMQNADVIFLPHAWVNAYYNAEKFKSDLMKIAMTTLSSKVLSQDKEHLAKLAVDAVMRLKGSTNLESIQIIKKPRGSLRDSFLDEGLVGYSDLQHKRSSQDLESIQGVEDLSIVLANQNANAKILVANTAMDTDKVKIYGACVCVDSMSRVAQIEGAEEEKMKEKVKKIIAHGINCFVNRQLIYNFPEELFADAGILAIEHADFDGIECLAVKLHRPLTIQNRFHVLDEAERSLHDALCVLSQTVIDSRVLLGGGWPEMALQAIPTTIADNAGLDSAELIAQLRAEHHKEGGTAGIDVISGAVGDMEKLGISEAFKVKQTVLLSATEAAQMRLRVDEIITCAPRQREDRR